MSAPPQWKAQGIGECQDIDNYVSRQGWGWHSTRMYVCLYIFMFACMYAYLYAFWVRYPSFGILYSSIYNKCAVASRFCSLPLACLAASALFWAPCSCPRGHRGCLHYGHAALVLDAPPKLSSVMSDHPTQRCTTLLPHRLLVCRLVFIL